VYFQHLYTSVNGVANRGARASISARRDWAAEKIAECVTFCDIVRSLHYSRRQIRRLRAPVDPARRDRTGSVDRAGEHTLPLPEFYNVATGLIPTDAVVAM
jgi:hypothetical protein